MKINKISENKIVIEIKKDEDYNEIIEQYGEEGWKCILIKPWNKIYIEILGKKVTFQRRSDKWKN